MKTVWIEMDEDVWQEMVRRWKCHDGLLKALRALAFRVSLSSVVRNFSLAQPEQTRLN